MKAEFQSLQEFWDQIPEKVLFISLNQTVFWANATARKEYKLHGILFEGKPCFELNLHLPYACNDCPLNTSRVSKRWASIRHKHLISGGREKVCQVEILPVLSGSRDIEFFVHIERDVTEEAEQDAVQEKVWIEIIQKMEQLYAELASQQQALEASRDEINSQKAQLEAIFSGFQDILIILNPHYEILLANQAYISPTSFQSMEELREKKCFQVSYGRESPCPNCTVTETIRSRKAASGERYAKEIEKTFFQQAYPILNDRGEIISIIQYSRNITEEKRLQEQLIQAEKMAGIGILASGVAHEINNPLTGILGLAEILLETEDPTLREQYLKEIITYSKRASDIVKDLATYSRIPRTEGLVGINLNQALQDALRMVKRAAKFGDIEVIEDYHEMGTLRANTGEIQQIFINLISNAVEALNGKGSIRLSTRPTTRGLEVVIQDTGPGIAKEIQKKIFDPFFTTKPPGQGTGLGLTVTHRLITKYRGSIEVETKERPGVAFRVIFPMPRRSPEELE